MASVARDKMVCIEYEINGGVVRVTPFTADEKQIANKGGIRL